ncbi:MAG TPA: hypothetical protein VIY56_18010 [Vicinamibacterales bacterium]
MIGLLMLLGSLVFAQPAAALDADYWRGGWRTPLGDEPHIYYFVIRGDQVTGAYCRNCSDATTMGFIDGTWDEKAGIAFTVTFANPNGTIKSVDKRHASLAEGRLTVTGGAVRTRNGQPLALIKDPRRPDPGARPAYYLPPGTPTVMPAARPAGGGGGAGAAPRAPYWQPGPFKALRPADVVGTWIAASFGPLGMNKQIFTFLLVGDRLRGVVCGRCDNAYTMATLEHIRILGDTLYFDITHQDRGEINPPIFDRSIMAQVVQNEMIASVLGTNVAIDPAKPPARPTGNPFTLVGPIAPEGTRGNSSDGIDVWGPGTGSAVQPPPR